MEAMVDATLVLELYIWYIIAGVLISVWALIYLVQVAKKRNPIANKLFGILIMFGVVWLGVVAAFDYSYGFTSTVQVLPLVVPVCLVLSQLAIQIILVVFRKKKH
jgi:hypothetical protein